MSENRQESVSKPESSNRDKSEESGLQDPEGLENSLYISDIPMSKWFLLI